MSIFENWCALNDKQPLPAAPADVARFVTDCAPLGIEKVWPLVQEISRAHYLVGLADPTLGGWVATAINDIAKIEPPRSWPKEDKQRFLSLPYDLQLCVLTREADREKSVHRAMQQATDARKELAAIQKSAKATDGIQSNNAA